MRRKNVGQEMRKMKKRYYLCVCLLIFSVFALLSGARQNAFAKEDTGYANSDWEGVKFITNELFGDNSIATIENLYNFNDSPDYIYVEFGNGGYVVYFAETMEMMEYSLSGNLFERTDSGSKKYYAGPTEVYNKQGDVFKNLLSGQSFKVNSSNVDNVSKQIHDWFLLSPIERCQFPIKTIEDMCCDIEEGKKEEPSMNKSGPSIGDSLIELTSIGSLYSTYIPNAEYFIHNPTFGDNEHNTCGSVAVQLLLGYNNYYNDRRIISPNYLNGGWNNNTGNNDIFDVANYSAPYDNLNVCYDPENLNSNILGTNDDFYDYIIGAVEPGAFNCTCTITDTIVNLDGTTTVIVTINYPDGTSNTSTITRPTEPGESSFHEENHTHNGSTLAQIRNGLSNILSAEIGSDNYIINSGSSGILFFVPVSSTTIKSEINAGRPLIIGMSELLGGLDHWVVGYGYQDYTYPSGHANAGETYSGYVVHFGWTGDTCVWINESWCNSYVSLQMLHTHNYNTYTERIIDDKIEIRCGTCGHRKLAQLYSTDNSGEIINGILYPISGSITIPSVISGTTITGIGNNAFCNKTNITNVILPSTLTSIGNCAFFGCSNLAAVSGLDNVTWIGSYAFSGCSDLSYFDFSSDLTTVGEFAFEDCVSITEIEFPNSLTDMGRGVLNGCYNLTDLSVPFLGSQPMSSTNCVLGYLFDYSNYINSYSVMQSGYPYKIPISLENVSITCGRSRIASEAFKDCEYLESIHISTASTNPICEIGDRAFYNCDSLFDLTFPGTVATIGNRAFYNCDSLVNFYLPNAITTIGDETFFWCASLTSISLPTSLTTIGLNAFYNCESLTSISIPSGVTSIGAGAFYGCESLTAISLPSGITSINAGTFSCCSSLATVSLPANLTSIGEHAFYNCASMTSINIPSGVTSIGANAFKNCSALTSISIPSGVTTINAGTFHGCTSLASVNLPSGLTSVGSGAFNGCTSLSSVNLPSSVTSVGANAFYGCTALYKVYIRNLYDLVSLGNNAFASTSANLTFYISYRLYNYYQYSSDWQSYWSKIIFVDYCGGHIYNVYSLLDWQPNNISVYCYTDYIYIQVDSLSYNYQNYTIIDNYLYIDAGANGVYYVYTSLIGSVPAYNVGGWIIVPYYTYFNCQPNGFYIYAENGGTMPQISSSDIYFDTVFRTTMIE